MSIISSLRVVVGVRAAAPLVEKARPGVLALALEQDVAVRPAPLRQHVADRTAHADQPCRGAGTVGDLEQPRFLDRHGRERHDIARRVEIDRLDVLVDDLHVEPRRHERAEDRQAERRHHRFEATDLPDEAEAPERRRKLRIHQEDLRPRRRTLRDHTLPMIHGDADARTGHP